MAHLTTGMDAPGKGREMKPVEFIPREVKNKIVSTPLPPELHKDLVEYCARRRLSQAAFLRHLISAAIWD